jgi:hypothetical protein
MQSRSGLYGAGSLAGQAFYPDPGVFDTPPLHFRSALSRFGLGLSKPWLGRQCMPM